MAFRYDLPDPPDAELAADIADPRQRGAGPRGRSRPPSWSATARPTWSARWSSQVAGALLHAGVDVLRGAARRGRPVLVRDLLGPGLLPGRGPVLRPVLAPGRRRAERRRARRLPRPGRAGPDAGAAAGHGAGDQAGDRPGATAARQAAGPGRAATGSARRPRWPRPAVRRGAPGHPAVPLGPADHRPAPARLPGRLPGRPAGPRRCLGPDGPGACRRLHLRLWTDVVTGGGAGVRPGPRLAAGVHRLAVRRGRAGQRRASSAPWRADPAYSMALLLAQAVQAGLPPSSARLPMTPDEVAAELRDAGQPARPPSWRRAEAARRPDDKLPEPFVQLEEAA